MARPMASTAAAIDRRLVLAAVVFGLAVGNHSLTLLLVPPIALYVLAVEPGILRRPRFIVGCLGAAAVTIALVFLELPIRGGLLPAPLVYGRARDLGRLLVHRARRAVPGLAERRVRRPADKVSADLRARQGGPVVRAARSSRSRIAVHRLRRSRAAVTRSSPARRWSSRCSSTRPTRTPRSSATTSGRCCGSGRGWRSSPRSWRDRGPVSSRACSRRRARRAPESRRPIGAPKWSQPLSSPSCCCCPPSPTSKTRRQRPTARATSRPQAWLEEALPALDRTRSSSRGGAPRRRCGTPRRSRGSGRTSSSSTTGRCST